MSGIVGLYHLDGRPLDAADLARMTEVLIHRGPDGTATWHAGSVGLGHCLLHTTPESRYEALPRTNRTETMVLTVDARLDNREALIETLRLAASPPHPLTDSEIILAAYERWGTACPEHLIGAFAFALWDGPRRRLVCARDPFGVKPLYYHHAPDRVFAVASEIKSLFVLEDVPIRLHPETIAGHLLVPVVDDPTRTFFKDVACLAPGHSLIVHPDGLQLHGYWALDPTKELRLPSDGAYAEAFRAHFEEAVRCRLRSAFPVGTMLSGGLDSSSITSVAARLLEREGRGPLHTFSAVYDDVPQCDERSYIRTVEAKYDLAPHLLHADRVSPLDDWDRLLWHTDAANMAGNLYINWQLFKPARAHGIRVLLDGFDGDTTVSHGRGYLSELAQHGHWFKLLTEVKAYASILGEPWKPAVWSWIKGPLLSESGLLWLRQHWRRLTQPASALPPPTRPPSAWRMGLNAAFVRDIEAYIDPEPRRATTERAHHYQLLSRALLSQTLSLLDAAAAPFSIELRFPFFDQRLVAFCLSLPPEQKLRRGWTRLVLRHAMEGILPKKIQWRGRKSNLGPGFEYALITFERERLKQVIENDYGHIGAFCDRSFLRKACKKYVAGEASGKEALLLWRAVSLALWLQHTQHAGGSSILSQTQPTEVMSLSMP